MTPFPPPRSSPRRALRLAGVVGFVLAALAPTPAYAATVNVAAANFAFQPESRSVHVGDVVRWSFSGDPHSVTSGAPGVPDGRFDSGIKDPGATYQVTFDTPGTYRYFCQIHPEQMTGTIVVTAGTESTPKPTAKPTATPRPTARPTASPRPTARATAGPSPAPTRAPATSTPQPAPTERPSASPSASPTTSPTAVASASSSAAPVASASPDGKPSPGAGPLPSEPASGLDPLPIAAGAVILAFVATGGLIWARGRRRT